MTTEIGAQRWEMRVHLRTCAPVAVERFDHCAGTPTG
jgi:hypothetical protein